MRREWDSHPNYAGSIVQLLLEHHDNYRQFAERLRVLSVGAPRSQETVSVLQRLAGMLNAHSAAENHKIFPVVEGVIGQPMSDERGEHDALHASLGAIERGFAAGDGPARNAIVTFVDLLQQHLDAEEKVVVPALLSLTAAEQWRRFHAH